MAAAPTTRRRGAWVLIAVTLLLALAIGGAVLVGSGLVKLPVIVDASASPSSARPSSSAKASNAASPSPVVRAGILDRNWDHDRGPRQPDRHAAIRWQGTGGGRRRNRPSALLATTELYDPTSRSWTATGSMTGVRILHTATLLADGKVLVAGGADSISETSVNALATAELYDSASGSWIATGPMIEARAHHTATLLAQRQGARGRRQSAAVAALARWPPPSCPTSPRDLDRHGTMMEARAEHTCHTAAGWQGAGGRSQRQQRPSAPVSRAGRPEHRFVDRHRQAGRGPRRAHRHAAPTAGCRCWVADRHRSGGHRGVYDPAPGLDSGSRAEWRHLDDPRCLTTARAGGRWGEAARQRWRGALRPRTGSWSATASMLEGRTDHTATLLDDGSVLMAGGSAPTGMLASAELYRPRSGN